MSSTFDMATVINESIINEAADLERGALLTMNLICYELLNTTTAFVST